LSNMETKDKNKINFPAADKIGQKNRSVEMLKSKISGFLISYFNFLVLALGGVIFALGLFLLVLPEYSQLTKENERARNNLQIEFQEKTNYLNAILELKKIDRSIDQADKDKVVNMVPTGVGGSDMITEIEAIIIKNGAILNSIKIDSLDTGRKSVLAAGGEETKEAPAGIFGHLPSGAGRIKMEINLSSVSYPVFKNIIKALENNLRLLDISNINFSSRENKAVLEIYSYFLTQ